MQESSCYLQWKKKVLKLNSLLNIQMYCELCGILSIKTNHPMFQSESRFYFRVCSLSFLFLIAILYSNLGRLRNFMRHEYGNFLQNEQPVLISKILLFVCSFHYLPQEYFVLCESVYQSTTNKNLQHKTNLTALSFIHFLSVQVPQGNQYFPPKSG